MSNYCSVGIDARIGLGFDRNRTSSRFCNRIVYIIEGIKKMFKNTLHINDVVDSLE